MELSVEVYRATSRFPRQEEYGLRAQIRRSAVSVASNIAEGQGRQSDPDFRRFLRISVGSLLELETQLHIAWRVDYLDQETARHLGSMSTELGRMLNGLANKLTSDVRCLTSDVRCLMSDVRCPMSDV